MALQLALPGGTAVPEGEIAGRAPDWHLPALVDPAPPAAMPGGTLFSPMRVAAERPAATGEDGEAAAPKPVGPLDGTFLVGAMRVGHQRAVILRDAGGRVLRLAPGGRYRSWQLMAIGDDAATFRKAGRPVRIEYGSTAPAGGEQASESEQ